MPEAARLHDAISHSQEGLFMKIGAVVGAVAGAIAVAGEVVAEVGAFFTGALTLPAIAGLGATVLTAGAQVAGATSFGMFIGKTLGSYFHHKAGEIKSAASTVFIGGQPAARGEADVAKCDDHDGEEPSKSLPVEHGRRIAEGSETVFIETFHAARKGDKGTCLFRISGGCDSVIIGGAKVQLLDIAGSETPGLDKVMFVLGVVSGLGALRQAMAKGAVAATAFVLKTVGVVGASVSAGEVAKRWAGGKWGEGSEQQEQATLTAQLGAGVLAERGLSSKRGTALVDAASARIVAEGAATRDAMTAFAARMGAPMEPALAGGGRIPGAFTPEIVPRPAGGVGMDAWNPPKNEPLQMSNDGQGTSGSTPEDPITPPVDPKQVSASNYDRAMQGRDNLPTTKAYEKKTVASTQDDDYMSGWGDNPGAPDGYKRLTPEEVRDYSKSIDHELAGSGANDQLDRPDGFSGKENASHAEKQAIIDSNGEPVGVSKDMCADCRRFARQYATKNGQTLNVTDPDGTWTYNTDGTVVKPDGTIVPAGKPITSLVNRYKFMYSFVTQT